MTDGENDTTQQSPAMPHFRVQPQIGKKKQESAKPAAPAAFSAPGAPKFQLNLEPKKSAPAVAPDPVPPPAPQNNQGSVLSGEVQTGVPAQRFELAPDPLENGGQPQEEQPAAVLQYQPTPAATAEGKAIRNIVNHAVKKQLSCTFKEELPLKKIYAIGGFSLLLLIILIVIISLICGISSQRVSEEDAAMLRNIESTEELQNTLDGMTIVKRQAAVPVLMGSIREEKNQNKLTMLLKQGWVDFDAPESLWLGDAVTEDGEWILNALVESECDLNFRLYDNKILLDCFLEAKSPNPKALDILLKQGIDVNKIGNAGCSIIFQILQSKESVEAMVKHGASIGVRNDRMNTPLMESIERGYYDTALYLVSESPNVNQINIDGNTPIMLCLKKTDVPQELISKIIEKPYRPNNKNKAEETAISLTLKKKDYDLLEKLIKSGAQFVLDDLANVDGNQYTRFRDLLGEVERNPIEEKKPVEENGYYSLPFTDNEIMNISLFTLAFWVIWFLLGQASGRMVCRKWEEREGIYPWLNIVLPLCGPLPWFIPMVVPASKRLWALFSVKVGLAQQTLFLQADQTEYQFADGFGDNKFKPVIQNIIFKLMRTHGDYCTVAQEDGKTVVRLFNGKNSSVIKSFAPEEGQMLVRILKRLIGVWGSKEPAPGGRFIMLCNGMRFRVGISMIPQEDGSEQLIISVQDAMDAVTSLDKMQLTAQQKARINQFLAPGSHGLMIVSSPDLALCDEFTSLMLDKAAGLQLNPIWFRDDIEEMQKGAVTKMNVLTLMQTQTAELTASLGSCRMLAHTWKRTISLDVILGLAQQKPVILSMEGDLAESVKNVIAAVNAAGIPAENILQFAVRPYPLHPVCQCAQPEEKLPATAQAFACNGIDGETKMASGCYVCGNGGWLEPVTVYDVLPAAEVEGWTPGLVAAAYLTAEGILAQVELNALLKGVE